MSLHNYFLVIINLCCAVIAMTKKVPDVDQIDARLQQVNAFAVPQQIQRFGFPKLSKPL